MSLEEALEAALRRLLGDVRKDLAALQAELKALAERLPPPQGQLVTVPAAAKYLGVCEATIRRHIKSGRIPIVAVGKGVRVDLGRMKSFDGSDVSRELRSRNL